MQEKIEKARADIWQALKDYGKYSNMTSVMEDASDDFVNQLAHDSSYAKQELREMLRKSPAWNEDLDALVINGTRTHDPDYDRVRDLALQILHPVVQTRPTEISKALRFFTTYGGDHTEAIAAIMAIAPKAYAPGKKKSRVFKAMCEALGIVDNTAGSEFQSLYAQLADELSAKKIEYKLFVSINPAHFVTMSNPKGDKRGGMLTSCHSFNSTEYDYNCGCTGYARDNVTMIAFTVTDPTNPETLNNRKTTRQLYMYRPGNGLLLQSRMYNSAGGTHGAQAESKVYRDLIQREISECEGAVNLWKTRRYCGNDLGAKVYTGEGFGGYPDWEYSEFAAMVSVRLDHEWDYKSLVIGTYGLCVSCGAEIDSKLYCEDCDEGGSGHDYCDDCECECDEDDLWTVYDEDGDERHVCEDCRDNNYTRCDDCDEYYANGEVEEMPDGRYVCRRCRENHYTECAECGELTYEEDMRTVINEYGDHVKVCDDCREQYYIKCDDCGRYVHADYTEVVSRDGEDRTVCNDCRDAHYAACDDCGGMFYDEGLHNGLCDKCAEKKEEVEVA